MRNTKLWSVLLAAVLLCACVVGVLFVGAQAEGTAYTWTVDGVGTATDCYATVDAAMIAADAKTWAAGDSLTLSVTAETTTTFNTAATGGQANSGRNLFNIKTIFRADNTKLPITIDGGEAQVALLMTAPVWKPVGTQLAFAATNDYTFKNLNLSSWAATSYAFYAGAGMVTFENVEFGATQNMTITAAVGGWTPFVSSWNQAKFDANKAEDGLLETGFIFKNTDYGAKTGILTCKSTDTGIAGAGVAVNDLTIKNTMMRNKIVIGEGATVANIHHYSANGLNTLAYAPAESVVEVDGGTVGYLYSVRSSYTGTGNKIVSNIKSGTVDYHRMGPNAAAGKFTGDMEVNWTGGTVTKEFFGAYQGTIDGDVTINIKNANIPTEAFAGSTITGTLTNTIEDSTLKGQVYLGSSVAVGNVVNNLKGTINTSDNFFYLGNNGKEISGNVTNNIAADIVYTGTQAMSNRGFNCGSNTGAIIGTVTNNILPGADLTDYPFIAGSNTGAVGAIVNNMSGGHIGTFYATNGINNTTAVASVKSTLTGGEVNLFAGVSGAPGASITKVENTLGAVKEDGSYEGTAWIKKFYGGAQNKAFTVGEIVNTYYAGTIGAENREDEASWFTGTSHGGSLLGTVDKITNNFYGGIFNVGYFYCGNAGASATFNAEYELGEGEYRITNNVVGGHFARFAGGSEAGTAVSIGNFIKGASHGSITTRQGAFYGGLGADANTDVYNETTSFAPVALGGNAGDFTADLSKQNTQIVGGNNGENVQAKSVTNVLKNGVEVTAYFGGCNSGLQPKEIVNHIYDAEISTFFAGNKSNNYSAEMTGITTTFDAGSIVNYYGGFQTANVGLKIGSIENNINGGKITNFYGAHGTALDSNDKGEITLITNNIKGGEITLFVAGCYEATKTTAAMTEDAVYEIGKIVNNIGSDSIETRPVISKNFFGGCYNQPAAANANKVISYYNIGSIENTIDHAYFGGNSYLGTRYHTLNGITNVINNLECDGTLILGNNVGTFNGASSTVINGVTLGNGLVTDVNSSACVVGEGATFTLDIPHGTKIYVKKNGTLNLNGNFPAKGEHTLNVANFELIQTEYWMDGATYLTAPEGTVPTSVYTVTDNVPGSAIAADALVTGKSNFTAKSANLILTERVAVRIVFDKAVTSEFTQDMLVAMIGDKEVVIKIDPNDENAVIIYGIGLKDFGKVIKLEGLFPALADDKDSIIELSDYAVTVLENNKIYKAIADFGRVATGGTATYGLNPYTVESQSQAATVNTGFVTGKNLVMSDAIGFRYYATLAEGQTIEDVKVFVEGTDYTEYCNIAFVSGSETEITIDFYLTIKIMSAPIDVQILVNDEVALEYVEYGNAIAAKIIEKQPDNALAKAALVYMQAAHALYENDIDR